MVKGEEVQQEDLQKGTISGANHRRINRKEERENRMVVEKDD